MEGFDIQQILNPAQKGNTYTPDAVPQMGEYKEYYPSVGNTELQANLQKYQEAIYNSNFDNKVLDTDGRTISYQDLDDQGYSDSFKQWISNSGGTFGKLLRKTSEYSTPEGTFTEDPNNPLRPGDYGKDIKTAKQARKKDSDFFSDMNPFISSPLNIKEKAAYPYYDQETGKYYLKLIDGNEKQINALNEQVYSAYGSKPFTQNFLGSFYTGLSNTLGASKEGILNMGELLTDLGEGTSNYLKGQGFKSEEGLSDLLASDERIHNRINEIGTSFGADAAQFSSVEGLSQNLGSAVGSIIQYGVFGKAITAPIQALNVLKSPKSIELLGMLGAGAILNTGEAYTNAKQAGLDEEDAALVSIATGVINTAIEQKFGSNLLNKWLVSGGSKQIPKIILDEVGEDLTEKGLNKAGGRILDKVLRNITNFTKIPIVGTATEESFEEGMQTLVQKTAELLYDSTFGKDKEVGKGKFGTRFNQATFNEIFGSALVGGMAGAAGGIFVNPTYEKSVYPLITQGRSNEVLEHLDILKNSGSINNDQYEAYKQRVLQLTELWNKNSVVFSDVNKADNAPELQAEILGNIESQFSTQKEIQNKLKQIDNIKLDPSLIDAVKEEKIKELKQDILQKQNTIKLKNFMLRQYLPNEEGKISPFNKYVNREEVTKALSAKFLVEKELEDINDKIKLDSSEEETKKLLEQKEEITQVLKEVNKHYKTITSAKYQREYKKEKEEEATKKKEDTKTPPPPEPTGKEKPLGTVQLAGSTEEYNFFKRNEKDGIPEWEIDKDGKREIVSFKDKWRESTNNASSYGKEVLHGVNHFTDMYTFGINKEKEILESLAKERSHNEDGDESNLEANKAKILEEFKGSFPAIENRALLDKVLQRADWKNYIKLVAINKYTGKKEQEEHPVVFTNAEIGVRGVRKKVVDIIMEITNPETGEVSILSHPYSPEYYEIESNQTQGVWNKLDFSNLPYSEFEKRFSFQYGELTPETYNTFQQNYIQAKEFFRVVTNKFLREGEHEIDPTWYSMSPSAEFDWNTQYDKEPSLAQLGLSDAPVVFGAEAFTPLSIQTLPNGMNLPPFKNQQAYYAFKQFENGVPKFIMIHPKQIIAKDEQDEVFNKLNALREEAKLLTSSSDNIKDRLQDINSRVPFFIRSIMKTDGSGIDYTVFVKADTHKTKGVNGVSLPVEFKIEIRYGDRSRQRYFTDNITSWKDLIHFINTTDFEQDGIKRQVHINPSDVRVNIPRTAMAVPNIQKQFVSSTTDKIVKPWTVKFNFHAEQVVNGVPAPLVEKPKVEPDPQDDYNDDSGIPFKIKDGVVTGSIQNIDDAYKWMESKLPEALTIEDLDTIRDQVKNHGITLGTVIGHTMYLDGTHAKNTFFHEVFHIVFRNLFNNKRIVAFLRKAKEELNYSPEQLKDAIKDLRSKSSRYTDLSEATMERLVYEEYLADKYADYTEKAPIKSWLRDIFDKIKAWIKFLFNNPDIESMVTLMEAGAFRDSKIKQNYFNGDGSTTIPLKLIRGLSAIESRSMVQKVFKKYINTQGRVPVSDLIEDLINWYNPELPGNLNHLEESPNRTAVQAEMLRAYQALIHPEAKKIVTSEVLRKIRKLRTFQSKIEIEEIENLEDKERVYDVPEFERNPADRVSARVKEFLSSISYNTLDPISQRIYDEGISWEDMYNRLLPVLNLNATAPENIPNRLSQLGKEDVKVQAVYNALSERVGLNLDELSNPNFLQEFKTAFALRPAPFGKVVGSTNKSKSQLFIVNEGKLGEYKADLWMSPYLLFKHKASVDAKVKASAIDKLNTLVQHVNGTNIIDNPVDLALELFTEIGLPITRGYAEVSFNNEPPINDSIEPIRKEDLLNLRSVINFNEDLYGDDRIYLIKRFSNSDAQYDTNLIVKSSQNAEGKMIYSYTADSEILSKTYDLKNEFKYKDTVKLALQDPYMSLNPYLYEDDATKNFSNLKIILTGNSQLVDEDGTSMKNSDEFSHMVMLHSLYNATEELDKQEYSWYWLTQVEAKNTQYTARMAKRSYYSEIGITPLGIKHISSMVEQELNRLQGEYGTGFQAEGAVYFPFLNEPEFKGKTFNQIKDFIPAKMNEIISDMIRDQEDYLEQYDLKRYIHPNETNFQQYLGNFILNDFINTNNLLKLIIGDMAWAKNWEDFVKRNSRLIASGPNMGTDKATIAFMQDTEVTVNINGKDAKVKVDDAQMYALVDQKLLDLSAHGAIDQSIELALNNIINPINEKGKYDAKRYSAVEKTTYGVKVDLVPAKQVISGETTDKKRIYQKMGIMYLTRELTSRWNEVGQVWEPLRGKDKLHNMYEFMLTNKVNFIAPKSASKLYFPENAPSGSDFYKSSKVKLVTVEFSNQDRRKQLDNDTHQKDTIKAGPQLINISGSELLSPEAQRLRNDQLSILNEIKQRTFDDIKKMFLPEQRAFLAQKLRDNIEKNTGDSQLIELLEDLNGDLKYGTNLLHVAAKEEEIFFSMFKDAYSTRISGRHLTHVSPEGFQVLYHIKSGRIVSSEEQRANYDNFQSDEYAVRDLAYGEIMLPRKWMDLAGLKPGDTLTNEIFKMLGFRIPAQNYHSMTTLTVADFLPDYYGDTIVAYKEIYALMGSDNDIDALYTFIKAWYNDAGTIKVYGQEKTPEEEYVAYNHDILERNSYLNTEISDLLTADPQWKLLIDPKKGESDDITGADNVSIMLSILGGLNLNSADINVEKKKLFDKYTKEVLKKYNFPSTQSEWEAEGSPIALATSENNFINKTHEILNLPELKEALLTPMSTTPEKEAMEEFDKYSPKIPKKQFLGNSLNAKSDSYINQFASKPLVGPAVAGNSVSQFLTEHQIDLNPQYSFYLDGVDNPYNSYSTDNIRKKADDGSSVVGTIVDSVKTPLANIFNWAKSTLGQVNVLIGIGVPFVKQALFFKQHIIREYVKKSNFKDSPFSKDSNKRSDVYEIPRKAFEKFRDLNRAIETSELSDAEKNNLYIYHEHFQNPNTLRTEDLQFSLNPDLSTLENKIRYYGTQFQVISQFQTISEVSDYLFNISKILSTNKSAGKSVYDSKDILEAYNTIERTNDPEAEELPPVLGLLDAINNSDLLSDNKERLRETQAILKHFFIKLTPFFNKIESEVKSSLKPSGDENLDTKLMTYLNGQITKKNFEKMTPPLDPVKEAERIFLSSESLAKDIRKAQQNDDLKTNPFLSFLKPLIRGHERNKTGIDLVQADSRTNLTAEATDLLLKGYAHLMVLDKALAIKAYTYLVLKDNLTFANKSFIKYINPIMFQNLANGLKIMNEAVASKIDEGTLKELTNKTSDELRDEFFDIYAGDKNNGKFIKQAKPAQLEVITGKGTTNEKTHKIFERTVLKDILTLKLNDVPDEILRQFSTFSIKKGVVSFPQIINIGTQKAPMLFKKLETTRTTAIYKQIEQFDIRGVSPYLYSVKQIKELEKLIKPSVSTAQVDEDLIREIQAREDEENKPQLGTQGTLFSLKAGESKEVISQEELDWLKKNLPNVPVEIINDLIKVNDQGLEAYGKFEQGLITLSKLGEKGTGYHEAGHAVFESLPKEKQERLLDEGSKRYGIPRGKNDAKIKYNLEQSNRVNYVLKIVDLLNTDKAKQVFDKAKKNNWENWKFWEALGVPKVQYNLISKSYKEFNDVNDILTDLLANYSYTVEINTATQAIGSTGSYFREFNEFEESREDYNRDYEVWKQRNNSKENNPTQHYSNLTVPGGTNYTENEISTPLITPSIKGHAQFSTDNGIGWFRSDTQQAISKEDRDNYNKKRIAENDRKYKAKEISIADYEAEMESMAKDWVTANKDTTKTRRILEVQSDLFQKGRDRESLILNEDEATKKKMWEFKTLLKNRIETLENFKRLHPERVEEIKKREKEIEGNKAVINAFEKPTQNQFLQLLNRDNNWVTFFVKSIIQDSAKKGYEKVLFPSGNTASKVEGHTTLEEFKKQKEDRIKELERRRNNKLDELETAKLLDSDRRILEREVTNLDSEIITLNKELERVETEGFGALKPIYNFYENTVTNILNKTYGKDNVKITTDEYGNTWNEIDLSNIPEETLKNIKLNSPTIEYTGDLAIEEAIMKEFQQVMNTKEINAPKNAIGRFFQKLLDWIKNILPNRSKIDKLFKDINAGKYKNITPENTDAKYNVKSSKFSLKAGESKEVSDIKDAIKNELPTEISNAITVLQNVPADILGRDNLFLSLKNILNDNGINDEILINWLGVNNNSLKIHPSSIKSEGQITNIIQKIYNKKKNPSDHPELKDNKLALESFNKWVKALENYPLAFKDIMLTHAIKYLNPGRRAKYVLQLSEVALTNAYGIVANKPHELNRIGKLYDQEVLKTVSDAVGHEPAASAAQGKNAYWVHIPKTEQVKSKLDYETFDRFELNGNSYTKIDTYRKNDEKITKEEYNEAIAKQKEIIKQSELDNNAQFKVNVELLRKLSPSTWCTANGMASHYVENYDNYLLVVNNITVAGIEAGDKDSNGKVQVKEVTSRGNNGVASIDHLDDILAFFEKHNLDTNNSTIQRAIKAKEAGKTDLDNGVHNGLNDEDLAAMQADFEAEQRQRDAEERWAIDEHNGEHEYDPPDHEEQWEAEQQRLLEIHEVEQITTVQEALREVENGNTNVLKHFNTLPQELRNNEALANKAVDYDSHNVAYVTTTVPFYNELVTKAVTKSPYVWNYLQPHVKEQRPDLREIYNEYQNDDLPFSKTNDKIQGYYDPKNDKVVVVAKNTPVNEASKVAIHEVAHRGMLRMAKELGGQEELFQVLKNAETELMKKLPELLKRTGHTSLDNLMLDYGFDKNSIDGHFKLLQELAARWAETLINKPKPSWWKELLESIKNWIKKFTGQVLSEKEVDELVGGFVKYGTQNVGKEGTNNSEVKLSKVNSTSIDDALTHPERYDTIALDFDGTVVDTNAGIREGLNITPKEYYAQGESISDEDRNKVWDKALLTSLGTKLMALKRSGTYPMDKIKVITAGSFRKSQIASLLGIPEENVIIVTNPDTIQQYNLQDDVPLDKALILSTFPGKTLYIDDKFKNIAATKKLENVESMRYDSGTQDDGFIPKNKLQKSLLDTQQHLISRLEELGKQTGGENRKVVQSRIDTISSTINRLTKQGSYDILIGTAYSELRAVNAFIKEGTTRSLNEAKKILTWYSDFYQEISSDSTISPEQNTKLIDINNKIVQLNNRLNPALESGMFNHSKRVGMDYTSAGQMLAAQKDISSFTRGGLTPNETNIPIGRTIMKTLALIDLKVNEAVQEVNRRAEEIKKNLDKNWMERVFDKAGRFITGILPDYWDEQASVMKNLAEVKHKFYKDKSGTKADIKEAHQKVFDWHKDNNVYTYTKEDEEKYLEDYAYQKEFVFTNENDEVDRAGLEEWAFENGPFTGIVDPNTRIVDLSNTRGPKFKDGKYNTKWYQYLTATPIKKWENPEYDNVKDDEVYKFLRDLLEKAIKKLPHRATVDKDNFEKFLDSFKLDITSSGPKLRESLSGLDDFVKDSLMLTINASDLDASARSILDEKGYRKPYLRSTKITDVQKEVKDPFEAVLKFYQSAVAFEHKNLMEPSLLLLQDQLEHQSAYETNVVGSIKKTILKGGVKYPELIQNGLIKAAENTKYQIEARLYGKTRRDEDKRTLTPQELDEVQQWREEVKDWIKNGSVGERPKEPEFNKFTISKISDAIVDYTRIVKLGGGLFSGANNLAMGMLSNYNYAVRNKEFNAEDLDWATGKLLGSVMKYWFGVPFSSEKRVITKMAKKIAFARKKFGLDKGVMELGESNKPKWIEAAVEALMTFQEGGEYLIHAQLMLAMMRKIKIKNLKGEEKSLWDAYDDEFQWKEAEFGPSDEWNKYEVLDSNGQNVSKLLKFNDDLNKLRVVTQSDYQNPLMVKSKYQYRIFMLFRTWIPKAVHNRFGDQIGDDFKGRYLSYGDIKGQLGKNSLLKLLASIVGASALKVLNVPFGIGKYSGLKKLSNMGLDKIEDYFNEQGVSDLDIENFRANIKEFQHLVYFIGVWTLFASLSHGEGDDDDWMYNYLGNLGMRVSQDLSFFYYPDSFLGIIKDPIPIMSTIKDVQELASAAVDYFANPNKRNYKRGFRKGQSKVLKELSDLTPLYRQLTSTQSLINQVYGSQAYKYTKK